MWGATFRGRPLCWDRNVRPLAWVSPDKTPATKWLVMVFVNSRYIVALVFDFRPVSENPDLIAGLGSLLPNPNLLRSDQPSRASHTNVFTVSTL